MSDAPQRKGLRVFFIATGIMSAGAIAAGGFMLGSVQTVSATNSPSPKATLSIHAIQPTTKPNAAATPLPTRTPAPAATTAATTAPADTPADTAPDIPAFVPPAPTSPQATQRTAPKVPAYTPPARSACPADTGVVLTLDSARVAAASSVLDTYVIRFTLDNRQSVPVTLSTVKLVNVTSVRADGAETSAGSIVLPDTYDVQPGKHTFSVDPETAGINTYHGFGSPVVAFKLAGEVRVANSAPDINANSRFCQFTDVTMGPPLRGSWGS